MQIRPGYHSVTPRIVTDDIDGLVAFLRAVFDAHGKCETGRPAELMIGDSLIIVSDGGGVRETMPAFMHVYVRDADAVWRRAVAATLIEPPADTPYGDRRATVRDRWGNLWQIATYRDSGRHSPEIRDGE